MNFEARLSEKSVRPGQILSVLIIGILIMLLLSSCSPKNKEIALNWDKSPEVKIIHVSDPINFPGLSCTWQDERMDNHIPEGQVFGDGRIIWVEYYRAEEEDARRLMEGRLSEAELSSLLEKISVSGFFSWKDHYSRGLSVVDGPPNTIMHVNLKEKEKRVIVSSGAPAGFHELVRLVTTGAGTVGREYIPERGYLEVYPFYYYDQDQDWQLPFWPGEEAGFHLEELVYERGQYIEGPLLEFVWRLINSCPRQPVVVDADEAYILTLIIPNFSTIAIPSG